MSIINFVSDISNETNRQLQLLGMRECTLGDEELQAIAEQEYKSWKKIKKSISTYSAYGSLIGSTAALAIGGAAVPIGALVGAVIAGVIVVIAYQAENRKIDVANRVLENRNAISPEEIVVISSSNASANTP